MQCKTSIVEIYQSQSKLYNSKIVSISDKQIENSNKLIFVSAQNVERLVHS